jgi:hypothetical protein
LDHILFRNADPRLFKEPCVREAIGWVLKEDQDAIWIFFDKPVKKIPYEKLDSISGLLIIKSNILEMKEIE